MAASSTAPVAIPAAPATATVTAKQPSLSDAARKGHLSLNTFSPVNQNGSFEFDRVLKAGNALKRTRKTKSWKPVHLILRPNLLSIYRDAEGTKLRHQITLSDLTAVARQRDPKRKAKHVFGLFSPERNFHLEAPSEADAQHWVTLIRTEARIDEDHGEPPLSPMGPAPAPVRVGDGSAEATAAGSSSSDDARTRRGPNVMNPSRMHSSRRPSYALQAYSGNEHGSYSDFSDAFPESSLSLAGVAAQNTGAVTANTAATSGATTAPAATMAPPAPRTGSIYPSRPAAARNASQMSYIDSERVVYHGWLYLLKSKGGVRQWKTVWAVLRPKSLALYKDEEEYRALLVIQFPSIINAVDINPQSKSKRFCFQLITDERNYRFCATTEEELAKWLGALKSLIMRRKETAGEAAGSVETLAREAALTK
ncbi:PH domain-like protein [Trichodelitschia bisporula]|uniref:PH domain-like protein n=1 Tax=Trichodelitschia bisporula TaxID=703511 RepID=A0A6G1HRU3_9PEZI|nr:PH domain-like protein [Trichodelitschia bisporula]